ncbi:DUF1294 domain-containing protein [Sulfitobacter albidus]|uniref:DUF1294 domain-containing protein n=1 Tax=Sulfitobacter albidus TaxID=2829501 RepID=A0A975PLQ3_9RHOB|nr:DUF1294 domain-containing protein [Sulfitobacter albidus]QUJ75963.1 DUF1294 domain-containing protein [Sulfitobacter albidus]
MFAAFDVWNCAVFAIYARDKRAAYAGRWRIPERRLLALAALGGGAGAIAAQRMLRHKTHKQPFAHRLRLIAATQAGVAALLVLR